MLKPWDEISRRAVLKAGVGALATPAVLRAAESLAAGDDAYADAVLVDGEPPRPSEGGFTVVVLPIGPGHAPGFRPERIEIRWHAAARDAAS